MEINWKPVEPPVYQRGDLYETKSVECGYTELYRWINMNISTDWICDGTTKYYKQKEQVSYDEGQTWQDVIPYQYQRGAAYETHSTDCGYVPPEPIYRWTNMDISTDWICEYVPPAPVVSKAKITYIGGGTYEKECDENATLTTGDTRPTGYERSAMTSAVIGDCITSIGTKAFDGCTSLTSVTIPNSVTSIGGIAFRGCTSLTSMTIPDSVTVLDYSAFNGCTSLTSVTIPNSVTSIGDSTFASCTSLTSITIPNSVISIGWYAFRGCRGLTGITCLATTPPTLGNSAFDNTKNCPIYVPASSLETFKTASGWSIYADRIQAIP